MAMRLKVLLPFQVLVQADDVLRIVAESPHGAHGLLPRRRDLVLPLAPGILIYETAAQGELSLAVDEGVLVKAGDEVLVSVRRAMGGTDLDSLRAAVQREYLRQSAEDRSLQQVLAQLELGFLRRLDTLRHG